MAWSTVLFTFVIGSSGFVHKGQAVTVEPTGSILLEAGDLHLTCTGPDQVSLQWYHDGTQITSSHPGISISSQRVSGRTVSVLQKANVARVDGGQYECLPSPRVEPGAVSNVVIVSRSGVTVRPDSIYDGDGQVTLVCSLTNPEPVTSLKWYRSDSSTELQHGLKYSIDNQQGTLTVTNADLNDVGDYICRFQITDSYMKEQYVTLSCIWGYTRSQSYGCPSQAKEPEQSNCGIWENIATGIIPQRLQGVSIINMECRKNDQCTGLQCFTTVNMRRMQPDGKEFNANSNFCFGIEFQPCRPAMTFYTDTTHTVNPFSKEIKMLAGHYEVNNPSHVEELFITFTHQVYQNVTADYHNIRIRFQTKVVVNGNETWPVELAFDVLPVTTIPKLTCTNNQNPQYAQICNAQVDVLNPLSQIPPMQMSTETMINGQAVLVPAVQSYNVTSNTGYQRFCEGGRAELECPAHYTMSILSSMYGRLVLYADDPVCSHNTNGAADTTACQTNTTLALKSKCDGLQYCELFADDRINGNPCGGVNKYLDVIFTCVDVDGSPGPVCSQSQFQCRSGQCIPTPWKCDGYTDCLDRSDEDMCTPSTPKGTTILTPPHTTILPRRTTIPPQITTNPTRTVTTCEGKTVEVECPPYQLIHVVSAQFGHQMGSLNSCESDFPDASRVPTCMADSLSLVKEICHQKYACKFHVNNDVFPSNCSVVRKFFNMTYKCIAAMTTTIPPVIQAVTTAPSGYCFQKYPNYNAIWRLTLNGPRTESRPYIFFFGYLGDDVQACEQHCYDSPGCVAYTLFSRTYDSLEGNSSYSGLCYGRGADPSMLYHIPEPNVRGGFLKWHLDYCRGTRKLPGQSDLEGKCVERFIPDLQARHWYVRVSEMEIYSRENIIFEVRACHNAYIALSMNPVEEKNGIPAMNISGMYEIFLGEKNNTRSGIRVEHKGAPNQAFVDHEPLLSCQEYKFFWISWHAEVQVGQGQFIGEKVLFTLPRNKALSRTKYPIKEFAIYNGYGAFGHWRFCDGMRSRTTFKPFIRTTFPMLFTTRRVTWQRYYTTTVNTREFGCENGQFLCTSKYKCVGKEILCDGKSDCQNGEDEHDCIEGPLEVTEAGGEKNTLWWMVLLGVGALLVCAIIIGAIVGAVIFKRQAAIKRQQQDYAAAGFVNCVPPTVTLEAKAGAEFA